MKISDIEELLEEFLSYSRVKHSIIVACISFRLALFYKENAKKAFIAGLLHDIGKEIKIEDYSKYGIELDEELLSFGENICHGAFGSKFVEKFFRVKDSIILKAIESHTIGNTDMTIFDKIIFVSDLLDPKNNFEGIENIRKEAFLDINEAAMMSFEFVFQYLISSRKKICPISIKSWNSLLI